MQNIVEMLKLQRFRDSTRKTYYTVWKLFNKFFISLDVKPNTWEERIVLFTGHLVNSKLKSNSFKSYISAIKAVLLEIGYELNEDKFIINALTRACRLQNDKIRVRFPIHKDLLGLILEELKK